MYSTDSKITPHQFVGDIMEEKKVNAHVHTYTHIHRFA
jgi:hypothetical protein